MKLLFIAESFPSSGELDITGGVEKGDYFLAKHLAEKHQVYVITSARKGAPRVQKISGIHLFQVGWPTTPENFESFLPRISFILMGIFRGTQLSVDAVQGSNVISQFMALAIGRISQIPAVAVIADVYLDEWYKNKGLIGGSLGSFLEKIALAGNWHHLIAWSKTTKEKILKVRNNLPITVIGGAVEFEDYQDIKVTKYAHPSIIVISRLVAYKRVKDALEVFALVAQQIPQARLTVIGRGPQTNLLKKYCRRTGISNKVTFKGFMPRHHDVISDLKKSHVLLHTSEVEGFGLVTLEAAACGVPYVHSDLPVTREITDNGQGGLFYRVGDISQAAQAVIDLLQDKKLYAQKQAQASRLAQKYSWKRVAKHTENIYAQITSNR